MTTTTKHENASGLRQIRRAAHLTQALLAQFAGVSERDVMNMEQGKLTVPCGKYLAVADFFGVTIEELLVREAS